jgi:hypothetical protein
MEGVSQVWISWWTAISNAAQERHSMRTISAAHPANRSTTLEHPRHSQGQARGSTNPSHCSIMGGIYSRAISGCVPVHRERRPLCGHGSSDGARRGCCPDLRITEKIRPPPCEKCRARASCSSPRANRMIPVQSLDAVAPCASCTSEASRIWSAVCSRTSTAGPHPGAKMTPGGGIPTRRVPITARSASGPSGRIPPRGDGDDESLYAARSRSWWCSDLVQGRNYDALTRKGRRQLPVKPR